MSEEFQDPVALIEKQRYLIPCKCKLCNKGFKDIIFCQRHVYEEHPDRKEKNIIDNMLWNIEDDVKKYDILQDLEDQRNALLKKLSDDALIEKVEIPVTLKFKGKVIELKTFLDALADGDEDKKPSDDDVSTMSKDLKKYFNRFLSSIKDLSMGKEVENVLKKKPTTIESLNEELEMYLGMKKAMQILEK